jgi:hypothetical protein
MGCGKTNEMIDDYVPKAKSPHKYSMKDYNPIFDRYAEGFPNRHKSIPIVLVTNLKKAGICYQWSDGHSEIEINKNIWDNISEQERQWLIWHELHHCENNAQHNNKHHNHDTGGICVDDKQDYSCNQYVPLSIMRWYMAHPVQIQLACNESKIDDITEIFCANLMKNYNE